MVAALCATNLSGVAAQGYERLPVMAEVANLASGDHLNLREGPTASSADLGDLDPGQRVEVVARSEAGDWSQIIFPGGHGWVASRYLASAERATAKTGLPLNLQCSGTEPFWGLTITEPETVRFEIMGGRTATISLDWSDVSRNIGPGAYGFAAPGFSGVLRRAECSDGMSDATYGWTVDVLSTQSGPTVLYSGCCFGQ